MAALIGAVLFGLFALWFGVDVVLDNNGVDSPAEISPYIWIAIAVVVLASAIALTTRELRSRFGRKHP